jgi:hypothetical protein
VVDPASLEFIEPTDQRWTLALQRLTHDVYDSPQYVSAEARRLDAEPLACLVDDGDGLFLLPLVVRPVGASGGSTRDAISPYGYPGVLVDESRAAPAGFADACVDACLERLRSVGVCSAFVRLHPLLNASLPERLRRHPLTDNGLTVSIDLTQPEDLEWAAMSKGHTNAINRARRAGFDVDVAPARERVGEFAAVYADTLQRLGAAETYHFGDEHLALLAGMHEAYVATADLGGSVAGAYMFFESHGMIQMHLGGPRTEFRKPSPSHLMIHAIAQWGRKRGDTVVHLGGGVGGAVDDSLFMYKAGFSPRRHPYRTLRLIADHDRYRALTEARGRELGASTDELLRAEFFPAYRATPDDSG